MSPTSEVGAVVFDLDGVLVDSEQAWDAARRAVVAATGGRWRESATREMMGMSAPEWSSFMTEELAVPLGPREVQERVVSRLLASYEAGGVPLLPGAVEAVRALAAMWPLGLASSANRSVIESVLARAGIAACFCVTVSAEEVVHGKPAPDVYLAATRRLAVEPGAAAAVEDSTNGLLSAAAAGLTVIAVPNRSYPPTPRALACASAVIDSLAVLTPALVLSAVAARGGRATPRPAQPARCRRR